MDLMNGKFLNMLL
jgi:hypothetical protein